MKKEYFALWSLLAVAFAIFALLSTCERINVGVAELKPSGIAERLTREPEEPENPLAVSARDVAKASHASDVTIRKPKAEVDSAAHNILIFGDSMLEGLNKRLSAYADANGHKLNSVIWYSSTSEVWGSCDTLKVYLKRFKPTYIFISLGGNELFVKDIAKKRDKWVKRLLAQVGDIPYIWIGPPNWKRDTGINDLIEANVKPGCFFKSDGMHFVRQADGAHPTYESAALWMDSIARWMPRHAAHPIKMEKPKAATSRPQSVVMLTPPT